MKFYRNHYGSEQDPGESVGFSFFTSKAAAKDDAKDKVSHNNDQSNIAVPVKVEPTKAGIALALNRWAGHPDNG